MKIQLAHRTYHQSYEGCCSCHFAKISSKKGSNIRYIECPGFMPQPCYFAFKKQLFNDKIFKL